MNTGNNFPEVFALGKQGQFPVYRNSYLAEKFQGREQKKEPQRDLVFYYFPKP